MVWVKGKSVTAGSGPPVAQNRDWTLCMIMEPYMRALQLVAQRCFVSGRLKVMHNAQGSEMLGAAIEMVNNRALRARIYHFNGGASRRRVAPATSQKPPPPRAER